MAPERAGMVDGHSVLTNMHKLFADCYTFGYIL